MKSLLLTSVLALSLAACSTIGIPNGDVTGNISSAPTGQGSVRLAVVGVTFGGLTNTTVNQISVVPGSNGVYVLSLPAAPQNGGYRVIAYADKNNNSAYDIGTDPVTQDNGKVLVYASSALTLGSFSVPQGWSQWQNGSITKSGTPFNNYDLTF